MTCKPCAHAALKPSESGQYDLMCVGCCARFIICVRVGGKKVQEFLFAKIARFEGAPTREEILKFIREHK